MLVFCRFNMRRKQDQEHLSNEKVPSDLLNIQGIAFAKKGQFEEAIECFVKAHELNPNNPLSWYNIGTSLAMVNKEDKALLILYCYERAIELDPYNAEAWNNKGAIMEMMGSDKSALACYERSLEIRPGYPSAISNIELLLKKLGYRQASKKHSTPNRKLTAISDALNNVSFD